MAGTRIGSCRGVKRVEQDNQWHTDPDFACIPADGVPQPPNRPGQQQQFSRYQLPQDPRYPPPSGQYRMQPPTAAQQQQQRRALYEQHMALLHLQQQQQQQGGYEQLSAAQLAELQGVPLAGPMGSDPLMSDEAILGLQAQVRGTFMDVFDFCEKQMILLALLMDRAHFHFAPGSEAELSDACAGAAL